MRHAAVDAHVQFRHVGELDGVVGSGEDRLGQVQTDLALDDIEGGRELDVPDMIAAQIHVHQPGDELVFPGGPIELDALHQR